MRSLRILTWHIHGSYLYYLTQSPHQFYLPIASDQEGYGGKLPGFPWPDNVHEVPAEKIPKLELDLILLQSLKNYAEDRYELLSTHQCKLPTIYLEHDPPQNHPTNTRHLIDDPNILMVHVTHFNDLMWDCQRTPTTVVEHGVIVPENIQYTGELDKGLVVVNNLRKRGRRLGLDVFEKARTILPLDLVGMNAEEVGGLGEIKHDKLFHFQSQYRFFFNPIRYTSLGLAVCEAMSIGMPIIGLATTEMVTVIENGMSGYIDTNIDRLIDRMQELLNNPKLAKELSVNAKKYAKERFNINRFIGDWNKVFRIVCS